MFLVSGRSSATGDVSVETVMTGAHASLNIDGKTQGSLMTPEYEGLDQSEMDLDMSQRLHALRIRILDRLISYLPELRNINGMRAIPFLQVSICWKFYSDVFIQDYNSWASHSLNLTDKILGMVKFGSDLI